MRTIIFIICMLLFVGCTKKEVKLPLLGVKGIHEIQNHSEVWMFLNVEGRDTTALLNKKNIITATHWIFNIDKHLSLKVICNQLNELKEQHRSSAHSVEGMHNYLSYADTISKQVSLYEIDNIIFNTENQISKNIVASMISKETGKDENVHLIFSEDYFYVNNLKLEKDSFDSALKSLFNTQYENQTSQIHLNFDQNLSYQDYLYYRTTISSLKTTMTSINSIEYIFDKEKVANCNCD